MIRSMTGFTRMESSASWGTLTMEMRSVNHRYLDIALRLPEELRSQEPQFREQLSQRLGRGKVDVSLRYQPEATVQGELIIDQALAKQIAHASQEIDGYLYNAAPVSSLDVLRWPGILQTPQVDKAQLGKATLALLQDALSDLIAHREREGEKLKQVLLQRCGAMQEIIAQTQKLLPDVLNAWRDKLVARIKESGVEHDEARLEQELVYMAQKTDVDEELVRLETHIAEVSRALDADKPVGRRLDFLMQELNREANTLGSKSISTETTKASVDLKVLIEQMREQVQNIE